MIERLARFLSICNGVNLPGICHMFLSTTHVFITSLFNFSILSVVLPAFVLGAFRCQIPTYTKMSSAVLLSPSRTGPHSWIMIRGCMLLSPLTSVSSLLPAYPLFSQMMCFSIDANIKHLDKVHTQKVLESRLSDGRRIVN